MAILGQLRYRVGTPQPPPVAVTARAASKNTPPSELMTRGTRHARRMQKLRGCARENSIFWKKKKKSPAADVAVRDAPHFVNTPGAGCGGASPGHPTPRGSARERRVKKFGVCASPVTPDVRHGHELRHTNLRSSKNRLTHPAGTELARNC